MATSKIDSQSIVDVDPDVIVSRECEDFSSTVSELGADFGGEMEVVAISVKLRSHSFSIDWEVIVVVIGKDSGISPSLGQGDLLEDFGVDSGNISVPLSKSIRVGKSSICGGNKHWLSFGIKFR